MARAHWPLVLVFVVSLIVYLMTIAHTIHHGLGPGSIEFITAAYNLGIPHSTGYPLYLVLGKLFSFLPVGDVGYRINLMSAVFAAGTSVLILKIAFMLTRQLVPALPASLFFSFSYFGWTSAVFAEVYTLQAFLTALIIFLWFRWEAGGDKRLMYGAALVWGLSLGNHMTIGLLALPFAYLVVRALVKRTLTKVDVLVMVAVFVLGAALIYAYLPWRYLVGATPNLIGYYGASGEFVRVDLTTPGGMWWMLSGQEYGYLFFSYDVFGFFGELGDYFKSLYGNFLAIGVVLGIVGMVRSARSAPHRFAILFLVFALSGFFVVNYGAFDKSTLFVPTHVVWALWMAEGIAYIAGVLSDHDPVERFRSLRILGQAITKVPWQQAALLLPVAALVVNFSYADVSSDRSVREGYYDFLSSVEPDALITAWFYDSWPLLYLQIVEQMRPEVTIIGRYRISRQNEVALIERSISERPVYVFGNLPLLTRPYEVEPVWTGHKIIGQSLK